MSLTNDTTGPVETVDPSAIELPRGRRRGPRFTWWIAAALALLLAGGVTAYWVAGRGQANAGKGQTRVEADFQHALLAQLNSERKAHHLAAVHLNRKLDVSSRNHSALMAQRNTMSHRLQGERAFSARISGTGYKWSQVAENVAWTSRMTVAGVRQLQTIMYTEKPPNDDHRENILGKRYRDVGIGVIYDKPHHRVWITEDFGRHA
jgi:uncharacterized protein YkwD